MRTERFALKQNEGRLKKKLVPASQLGRIILNIVSPVKLPVPEGPDT